MIEPKFRNINRLFVLSLKNGPIRDSFDRYYMPLIEINDFNALIDNKPFFWSTSGKQARSIWKIYRNLRNDHYTTGH